MQYIHRFEADLLIDWLHKPERKPLIIRGARQVGKSSLVRYLAKSCDKVCFEINFERYPNYADFFKSKDPKSIINNLSLHFKNKILPNNAILFLDEIQAATSVIETLRYFYEEMPELPVIAAGSLLEFVLAEPDFSIPVGRIEYFHLGPICFEDFLKAKGEDLLLEWIQSVKITDDIPAPIHQKCLDLVKQFWLIGGMPEVISHYLKYHHFDEANNIKQSILQGYKEDFHKYGRAKQIPLLRTAFQRLPNMIGQKIKYTHISTEAKSAQVKQAIEHLSLAKIIHLIYHSHANGLPLRSEINYKIYKAIFLDIGLLCATLGLNELEITQALDFAWINRGILAEQFIGQTLFNSYPLYQAPELHYWMREAAQSSAEVDYILQIQNKIIPVEIKAGKTGRMKSLHYFIREKNRDLAVRFNTEPCSLLKETVKLPNTEPFSYTLLSLPFYLAGQLKRLLAI